MDETGGQISNVGQQVDGSSDAEESQRLVSYSVKFNNIYNHKRYKSTAVFYLCDNCVILMII